MSFFSSFVNAVAASNEKRARVIALQQLRAMSTRQLSDLGFDSRLLDKGIKGWPWRTAEPDDAQALENTSENYQVPRGMAGRPVVETIDAEIYSTGSAESGKQASKALEAA